MAGRVLHARVREQGPELERARRDTRDVDEWPPRARLLVPGRDLRADDRGRRVEAQAREPAHDRELSRGALVDAGEPRPRVRAGEAPAAPARTRRRAFAAAGVVAAERTVRAAAAAGRLVGRVFHALARRRPRGRWH